MEKSKNEESRGRIFWRELKHYLNGVYSTLWLFGVLILILVLCPVLVAIRVRNRRKLNTTNAKALMKRLEWRKLSAKVITKFALLLRWMIGIWDFVVIVGKKMVQLVLWCLPYTPHTIKTLTLNGYEKIQNGDLGAIVRRGVASYRQKVAAINEVQNDFALAVKNIFYQKFVELDVNIAKERAKLALMECARFNLQRDNDTFYSIMRELNIHVTQNIEEDARILMGKRQQAANKVRMLLDEKKKLLERQQHVGNMTFTDTLIEIQMGLKLGFALTTEITLQEYAAYLKTLEKVIEQNERAISKYKHKGA